MIRTYEERSTYALERRSSKLRELLDAVLVGLDGGVTSSVVLSLLNIRLKHATSLPSHLGHGYSRIYWQSRNNSKFRGH